MIKGALPVGILGIGEPLIFGVTLPLGRPFIGACLGGAVGGALISYWKVATVITFGISGLPLALTIVSGKVMLYLAGMLITIIAGFLHLDDGVQRSRGVAFERQAATTGRRGAPRGLFRSGRHPASGGYVRQFLTFCCAAYR